MPYDFSLNFISYDVLFNAQGSLILSGVCQSIENKKVVLPYNPGQDGASRRPGAG